MMNRFKRFFLRFIKLPPQLVYALGLGPIYGRLVLLLTTIGRKSGLPRVTPLQYEEVDGIYYVAAARGQKADWFRNIIANPHVEVRVRNKHFQGLAEPITDPARIADFLELRLERRPRMIGAMFLAQGWPTQPDRTQLEQYAANRAMVVIRPNGTQSNERQNLRREL
jgi:deazaflavin-dependent oxidoreductase (nitroreductase family)